MSSTFGMNPKATWRALLLCALLALGMLVGCKGCKLEAIPKTCKKAFAKCLRPEGPIGVCTVRVCKPGEKKPCLACTSQH